MSGELLAYNARNGKIKLRYSDDLRDFKRDAAWRWHPARMAGPYTLTFKGGGTWNFNPFDGSPAEGRIDTVADRNGNALAFGYDGVGRLIRVTDTLDRDIDIAYNAEV